MWPAFAARHASADPPASTPAPLRDDARIRATTIAFEERRAAADPQDQITPRMLAEQYLQRYRERGDAGDLFRAEAAARRSLGLQPKNNVAALQALASAQLALHRFRAALATVRAARRIAPREPALAMSEAALALELGDRAGATELVTSFGDGRDAATEVVASRLAELTGDLPRALTLLERASRRADAIYGSPNERRAWFHVRLGELRFEGGDVDGALADEQTALARFPADTLALTDAARFSAAVAKWSDARAYAQRAAALTPSPEALGMLADAQARLGDAAAASATRDEILAVERIGNAQHLVDRLLAVYYADHGIRLDDAYAIALRDAVVRDDVYAEDTLAWTAARAEHWAVARAASRRAIAWGIADARVWYHAGVIAEHDGDVAHALEYERRALALNPRFQAGFAERARDGMVRLELIAKGR